MGIILHITTETEWEKAKLDGFFAVPSLVKDGFIHCSVKSQVLDIANYKFKGQSGVLLLEIDEAKVAAPVKYEDLYNLDEDYPHIYGPLNLDAVRRAIQFPAGIDGVFVLPEQLA